MKKISLTNLSARKVSPCCGVHGRAKCWGIFPRKAEKIAYLIMKTETAVKIWIDQHAEGFGSWARRFAREHAADDAQFREILAALCSKYQRALILRMRGEK
jgi:hypothetical protein